MHIWFLEMESSSTVRTWEGVDTREGIEMITVASSFGCLFSLLFICSFFNLTWITRGACLLVLKCAYNNYLVSYKCTWAFIPGPMLSIVSVFLWRVLRIWRCGGFLTLETFSTFVLPLRISAVCVLFQWSNTWFVLFIRSQRILKVCYLRLFAPCLLRLYLNKILCGTCKVSMCTTHIILKDGSLVIFFIFVLFGVLRIFLDYYLRER